MIDFTQALAELQMSEAELQNLIQRGDLRAFRSGGTVKFRRADIDMIKKERATEPTIIIPAGGTSALNQDVPQDLGVDESAATVVPETTPGGAAPTVELGGGQSGTEEIVFEDTDLEILPLEDASAATAEVTVAAEKPVEAPAEEPERPSRRAARRERREEPAVAAISRRTQAAYAREPSNPVMTAFLVFTSLVCVYVASVFAVILWKGYYSEERRAKYVPSFLQGIQDRAKDWGNPE
jgi:hypothetical protein